MDFNRYVIDALNELTAQFLRVLEVSRTTDPTGRIGGALNNLFDPVLQPKIGSLINISQEELGELAGLSRTTVNACRMKLRNLELVHTEYGGLIALDLEKLKSFVYSANFS